MKSVMTKMRGPGRPPKDDAIRRENSVQIALSDATENRFKDVMLWMSEADIKSRSEAGRLLIESALDVMADENRRTEAVCRLVEMGRLTEDQARSLLKISKTKRKRK